MLNRPRQLVVVIDDIDRLPANEIQLLLRAVRANADFPNLVFLLVFERDVVEKAIADQAHVDGGEYLKKIIQLPFSVPLVDPSRLRSVLFARLDAILDDLPATVPFDTRRWGNMFFGGMHHYFQTLRDVYRYTTTVDFHLSMFRSAGSMEVNQIDLLGLEALRVFEPRLYAMLPSHNSLLLEGPGRSFRSGTDRKDAALKELEQILEHAPADSREAARSILAAVFQPIEWLTQNYGFGSGFEEGWDRGLRACSEKYFGRYFQLSIPAGDVAQDEVQQVLAAAGDRGELVRLFTNLRDRGLLATMIERLEAYKERINTNYAVPFTTAIFDIGDGLPGASGMFGMGADMHAARVVFWFLKRLPTIAEREAALMRAIRDTIGVQLPAHVVSMERRGGDYQKRDYLVSEERLPEFNSACAEKIRAAATTGQLAAHPDLPALLYRWREWGSETAVRNWVRELASTTEGAMRLVQAFTHTVRSHGIGDYVSTSRKVVSLKDISVFIEPDTIAEALAGIDRTRTSELDTVILRAFDRAMRRRREGKPDRDVLDTDEDDD